MKGPLHYGGRGEITNFLCGAFEYDRRLIHPLIESLPDLIHIKGADSQEFAWLRNARHLLNNEAETELLGSSAVIDRLSEVIFSQILRVYIQKTPLQKGFLNALKDESIVQALRLIHANPEYKWTIAELAQGCGVSRSALADRFKTPLRGYPYEIFNPLANPKGPGITDLFTTFRLPKLPNKLAIKSESAFSNAFKKITGKGPGLFRREFNQGTG